MAIMSAEAPEEQPITLKEVQLRLGVPQHVLIHLCEKGVIEPDFAESIFHRIREIVGFANERVRSRIDSHSDFIRLLDDPASDKR